MTYPDDDDEITFDMGAYYEEADLEWWNDSSIDPVTGMQSYTQHDLWHTIESRGWEQVPSTFYLQRGNVRNDTRVLGGRYYGSIGTQENEGQSQPVAEIIRIKALDYEARQYGNYAGEGRVRKIHWEHEVGDERENFLRLKTYNSLGEALDEAEQRRRGQGYNDYTDFPIH